MKIKHKERNSFYEITEAQGIYTLIDSTTNSHYNYSQVHDALWKAIELIRAASFSDFSITRLNELIKRSGTTVADPKEFLCSLQSIEINRTYYDRIFMKLVASYRMIADEVVISNKTNFIIDDEVHYILRKKCGVGLRFPIVVHDVATNR
jgi:hypothetical protein